jgi:iron only hydrogenase large subunit-like protein
VGEFADVIRRILISALKRLGFEGVSETALGAQQVSARVAEQLQQSDAKLTISSACPAAVDFVQKYLPEQADTITPILSPFVTLQAAPQNLRRRYRYCLCRSVRGEET